MTPERLQALAGVSDLGSCRSITLSVDTRVQSLGEIGALLPGLESLSLVDSRFSFSDFTSSFSNLKALRVENCGLSSLSGLMCLESLESLFARGNRISDLSPFMESFNLCVVDLRENAVADQGQLMFLHHLPLAHLLLQGNPVVASGADVVSALRAQLPEGCQLNCEAEAAAIDILAEEARAAWEILKDRVSNPLEPASGRSRPSGTAAQAGEQLSQRAEDEGFLGHSDFASGESYMYNAPVAFYRKLKELRRGS